MQRNRQNKCDYLLEARPSEEKLLESQVLSAPSDGIDSSGGARIGLHNDWNQRPPLLSNKAPVTHTASSEARNVTTEAMSSG
jgi:hypothetical protein